MAFGGGNSVSGADDAPADISKTRPSGIERGVEAPVRFDPGEAGAFGRSAAGPAARPARNLPTASFGLC